MYLYMFVVVISVSACITCATCVYKARCEYVCVLI